MSFRLTDKDSKILKCIAEYRILTVSQIAAIFHKKKQVAGDGCETLKQKY